MKTITKKRHKWTKAEDQKLWTNRHMPAAELYAKFFSNDPTLTQVAVQDRKSRVIDEHELDNCNTPFMQNHIDFVAKYINENNDFFRDKLQRGASEINAMKHRSEERPAG